MHTEFHIQEWAVDGEIESSPGELEQLVTQYEQARSTHALLRERLKRSLDEKEASLRRQMKELKSDTERIVRIRREMMDETLGLALDVSASTAGRGDNSEGDIKEKTKIDKSTWNWFHKTVDDATESALSQGAVGTIGREIAQPFGNPNGDLFRSPLHNPGAPSLLLSITRPGSPDSINSHPTDPSFMASELSSVAEGPSRSDATLRQSLREALSGIKERHGHVHNSQGCSSRITVERESLLTLLRFFDGVLSSGTEAILTA
ncbi:hypothetical protein FRC19_006460 [Serendipita sp. 401]|nr:hypothetical protein FRC19_006460 [Serendipita sp. 401]KAG9058531.1 hypothetical protein FS842_008828 [Serendipita sp. 407]